MRTESSNIGGHANVACSKLPKTFTRDKCVDAQLFFERLLDKASGGGVQRPKEAGGRGECYVRVTEEGTSARGAW